MVAVDTCAGCPQTSALHRNSCRLAVLVGPAVPLVIDCKADVIMKAAEDEVVTNTLEGPIATASGGILPYNYTLGLDPALPQSVMGPPLKSSTFTYTVMDVLGNVASCSVKLSIILGEKVRVSCRVLGTDICTCLHDLRDDTTATLSPLLVV